MTTSPACARRTSQAASAFPLRTAGELAAERAGQVPDAPAVCEATGTVSYRALMAQAALVAQYLGQPAEASWPAVALRMAPGAAQIAASVGALQAGWCLTWFGVVDNGERGRAALRHLSPACLLIDGDVSADPLARWYRDECGGRVVSVASLPRRDGRPALDGPATPADLARIAYIAFTSGSTGEPKGVAQTHGALSQFVTWMAAEFELGEGSRVAQWVAPDHDPSLCEVFASLVAGATLCPVPQQIRLHPEWLAEWLAAERITFFQTVPSLARELLDVIAGQPAAQRRLPDLRQLVLMGEAFPAALANRLQATLPRTRLANIYGPTETIAATWHTLCSPVTGSVPVGRPIPGRQVLVLDQADQLCPAGVTGEIVICGPYVAAGYLGQPDHAAFRRVAGRATARCYRTGDLGRWRPDGLLEFRGRRDLQVKLAGTRVELTEIETALAGHDSVRECAVVPMAGEDGLVTHLVAYVVARRLPSGEPAGGPPEWRACLRRQFGAGLRLVSFQPISHPLPRNLSGKVDRRRLLDPRGLRIRPPGPVPTLRAEPR